MPAVAQNTLDPPWQTEVLPEMLQAGGVLTVSVALHVVAQPLESLTVTEYVAAAFVLFATARYRRQPDRAYAHAS